MSGVAIGFLAGPPIGGALYSRFGFRGPFICGIIVSFIDLIGRLLILERKDALLWDFDPAAAVPAVAEVEQDDQGPVSAADASPADRPSPAPVPIKLSLAGVMVRLMRSSRAVVIITITFLYGWISIFLLKIPAECIYRIVYSAQEPTLPLHLQDVWGLDSAKVGLVYLAGVVPTLFCQSFSSWYLFPD
jgi:MFS family permease